LRNKRTGLINGLIDGQAVCQTQMWLWTSKSFQWRRQDKRR